MNSLNKIIIIGGNYREAFSRDKFQVLIYQILSLGPVITGKNVYLGDMEVLALT